MRSVTIAITGMHCASCGLLVDDCMLDTTGVLNARTDVKSGVCTVHAEDDVQDEALLAAVTAAGYVGEIR